MAFSSTHASNAARLRADVATFIDAIESPDVVDAMRRARTDFQEVVNDPHVKGITPKQAVQRGEHMRTVINGMGLSANRVAEIGRLLPSTNGVQEEFALKGEHEQIFAHILRAFDHVIDGTAEEYLALALNSPSLCPKSAKKNPPDAIAAAVELTQAALNPECTAEQRDEASANFKDLMSQIGLNATLVLPDAEERPRAPDVARGEVQVVDRDFTNIAHKLIITDPASVPIFESIVRQLDGVAPKTTDKRGAERAAVVRDVCSSLHGLGLTVKYLADLGRQLPPAEGEDAYESDTQRSVQTMHMRRAICHALVGARKNAKPKLTPAATDAVERRRAFDEMGAMLAAKDAEAAEPVQRDKEGKVSLRSEMRRQAYEWMNANPGEGRPNLHVNGRHVLDLEADPANTPEQPYCRTGNFQMDVEEVKVFVENMKHLTPDALSMDPDVNIAGDAQPNAYYKMYLSFGGAQQFTEGARKSYWRVFKYTTFEPQQNDVTGRTCSVTFPPGLYPLYLPPDYPQETEDVVKRMCSCSDAEQVKPIIVTYYNADPHENDDSCHSRTNHSGKAQSFWSPSELRDCVFAHFEKAQPDLMAYCRKGDDPEAQRLYHVMREKIDELAVERMRQSELDTEGKIVAIVNDLHKFFLSAAGKQAVQKPSPSSPPAETKDSANAVTDELVANDRHVMMNADITIDQMAYQEARCIDTDYEEMWQAAKDYQNLCDRLRHRYQNQCSRDVFEHLLYARDRAKALVLRCGEHHLAKQRQVRLIKAATAQQDAAFHAYDALAKEAGHKIAVANGLREEGKLDDAARVYKTALGLLKNPKFDPNDLSPKHRATLADQVSTCEGVVDAMQAQRAKAKEEERKARKAANKAAREAAAPPPLASSSSPEPAEEPLPRNRRDNTAHKRRQRARKATASASASASDASPSSPEDNGDATAGPKDWLAMAASVEDSMRAAAESAAARESADLAEAMARSLLVNDDSNPSENKLCVVCFEGPKSHACVPCGHQCLCDGCAANPRVNEACPLCRTPVHMMMKVRF